MTETWATATNQTAHGYTGIGEDQTGNMWMNYTTYNGAPGGGMVAIDVDTMEVGPAYPAWPSHE